MIIETLKDPWYLCHWDLIISSYLQLAIRLIPNHPPLNTPSSLILILVYSEQLGLYLQAPPEAKKASIPVSKDKYFW